MANPEHLKILRQGVEVWNRWREEHAEERPDLLGADLSKADLDGADLRKVCLVGANLRKTDLEGADLQDADLRGADLEGAELINVCLIKAELPFADLRVEELAGADVSGAVFAWTVLGRLDPRRIKGLEAVQHLAPSILGIETLSSSCGRLPRKFLKGCGLSDWEIQVAKLYEPDLSAKAVKDILNEIERRRVKRQYFSAFLSYSHADKSFARRLHDRLQTRGIRCWLDEHDLKPGDRTLDVVNDAIRLHDKILVCCSETSLNNWGVKDEIRKAMEREQRDGREIIIPLNLDGYLLHGWQDGMAADLRSRLAVDFTGWKPSNAKFEADFERLMPALRADERTRAKVPKPKL